MTDTFEPPPMEESTESAPTDVLAENDSPKLPEKRPQPEENDEGSMFQSAKDHEVVNGIDDPKSKPNEEIGEQASLSFEIDKATPALLPVSEYNEPPTSNHDYFPKGAEIGTEQEISGNYDIAITVASPEKMGDGIGAFMVYLITCTTSIPTFKSAECSVKRRFSDFLKLHSELQEKHANKGRIVPPAPEKSMQNLTKVKMSKGESTGHSEFIEKRRASLERYINRIARHPVLVQDPLFREFLESPGDLPYAKDMSYMSSAGIMRAVKNVGGQLSKMTTKMTETDMWFEMKQTQIEALDAHLRKLLSSVEMMVNERRILCNAGGSLAANLALLSQTEENSSVAGAISQLSELEHKVHDLNEKHWNSDYFLLGEMARDYIAIIGSIKNCFDLRVKIFQSWHAAQNSLMKKREQEAKLQSQGKQDKVPQVQAEIKVWEDKVQEGQDSFDAISKNIRSEVDRFEKDRAIEFKNSILKYLREMLVHQEKVLGCWQEFLPEAQDI